MATIAIANDPRRSHHWPSLSTHDTDTNTPIAAVFQKEPVRYSSVVNKSPQRHSALFFSQIYRPSTSCRISRDPR
jgi:hypothetical protein